MAFGETDFADDEQSPPHQRTHATEHDVKLINGKGRYRRFSHAGSLPTPAGTVLSLTPRNLLLSDYEPTARLWAEASPEQRAAWLKHPGFRFLRKPKDGQRP